MPTDLLPHPRRAIDFFVLFAVLVGISFFVLELVDPAPLESLAQSVAAP